MKEQSHHNQYLEVNIQHQQQEVDMVEEIEVLDA